MHLCTDNCFFSFVMLLSQGLFYSHDKLATLQGGQPWKKCLAEMWSKDKPQEQACLTMLMIMMMIRMMMSLKKTNISKIRGQKLETLIQFFLSILASDLRTTEHIQIQTWARSCWLMIVMSPPSFGPQAAHMFKLINFPNPAHIDPNATTQVQTGSGDQTNCNTRVVKITKHNEPLGATVGILKSNL